MQRLENIEKYGFTAVPRNPDVLFASVPAAQGLSPQHADYKLSELPFPDSELVRRSKAFVQKELNTQTFNHSHRVFVYGMFILGSTLHSLLNLYGCRHRARAQVLP